SVEASYGLKPALLAVLLTSALSVARHDPTSWPQTSVRASPNANESADLTRPRGNAGTRVERRALRVASALAACSCVADPPMRTRLVRHVAARAWQPSCLHGVPRFILLLIVALFGALGCGSDDAARDSDSGPSCDS